MDKRIIVAFAFSALLLIAVAILERYNFRQMKSHAEVVNKTRRIVATFERLSSDLKSAEVYTGAASHPDSKAYFDFYRQESDSIFRLVDRLQTMVADYPERRQQLKLIETTIREQLPVLVQTTVYELAVSDEAWRLKKLYETHRLITQIVWSERRMLATREAALNDTTAVTNAISFLLTLIAVGVLLLAFLLSYMLSRKGRRLETFLESVFNSSQNAIVSYSPVVVDGAVEDFKVQYANPALYRTLGVKPSEIIGKNLSETESAERFAALFDRFNKVVATGSPIEFETLYKNGKTERWVHASLAKRGDGLTASYYDITETKLNIAELTRSNAELGQYAYVASHDLQEPLYKIMAYGNILRTNVAGDLSAVNKTYLDKMIAASQRMSGLIRDILEISSLKREEGYVKTDLNGIVAHVLEDLELSIEAKQALVTVEPLPAIDGIPLQLNQLFYNLLNNALKFAQPGVPPIVSVSSRMLSPDEIKTHKLNVGTPYCEIVVTDNGIGFHPDYSTQIFGLFKRLNERERYQGSGIGLALCKKIVENHGGTITAHGEPDGGATFCIVLPCEQSQRVVASSPAALVSAES